MPMTTRRRSRATAAGLRIPFWLAEWAARGGGLEGAEEWAAMERGLKATFPGFNVFLLLDFVGREEAAAAAILAGLDEGLLIVSEGVELTVWDMDNIISAVSSALEDTE
jgi:hypothetical protein